MVTLLRTEVREMDEKVIEILSGVEGISVSDGLLYCGSTAAFIKFINSFYSSIEKKAADIKEAFDNEDFTLYTTKVHSLKSTSRIVGATQLSDFALRLEEAGRAGDISFIREHNEEFLDMYRGYIDRLSVLDSVGKDDESAELIPEDVLKDAYAALKENISMQEFDAVELILGEVKKYRLPKADKEIFDKLEKLLRIMDWDQMEQLI